MLLPHRKMASGVKLILATQNRMAVTIRDRAGARSRAKKEEQS
jgi:hypothetical protein